MAVVEGPARIVYVTGQGTLIPVPRLALDSMLFEIEATAVLPA